MTAPPIKVKSLGAPPQGAHWSYGPEFMTRIGERDARGLCGMYPLPRMGYETLVAIRPGRQWPSFKERLFVQNISGDFYLASTNATIEEWPSVFGVQIET